MKYEKPEIRTEVSAIAVVKGVDKVNSTTTDGIDLKMVFTANAYESDE